MASVRGGRCDHRVLIRQRLLYEINAAASPAGVRVSPEELSPLAGVEGNRKGQVLDEGWSRKAAAGVLAC